MSGWNSPATGRAGISWELNHAEGKCGLGRPEYLGLWPPEEAGAGSLLAAPWFYLVPEARYRPGDEPAQENHPVHGLEPGVGRVVRMLR